MPSKDWKIQPAGRPKHYRSTHKASLPHVYAVLFLPHFLLLGRQCVMPPPLQKNTPSGSSRESWVQLPISRSVPPIIRGVFGSNCSLGWDVPCPTLIVYGWRFQKVQWESLWGETLCNVSLFKEFPQHGWIVGSMLLSDAWLISLRSWSWRHYDLISEDSELVIPQLWTVVPHSPWMDHHQWLRPSSRYLLQSDWHSSVSY